MPLRTCGSSSRNTTSENTKRERRHGHRRVTCRDTRRRRGVPSARRTAKRLTHFRSAYNDSHAALPVENDLCLRSAMVGAVHSLHTCLRCVCSHARHAGNTAVCGDGAAYRRELRAPSLHTSVRNAPHAKAYLMALSNHVLGRCRRGGVATSAHSRGSRLCAPVRRHQQRYLLPLPTPLVYPADFVPHTRFTSVWQLSTAVRASKRAPNRDAFAGGRQDCGDAQARGPRTPQPRPPQHRRTTPNTYKLTRTTGAYWPCRRACRAQSRVRADKRETRTCLPDGCSSPGIYFRRRF